MVCRTPHIVRESQGRPILMAIVIFVLLAGAAFWFWSVNAGKNTKRKVLVAFVRAMEDQVKGNDRTPSWWSNAQARAALKQVLATVPSKATPYDPHVVREWLEAAMTVEDISTFLYHAETLGFSPSEQIALAPDVALLFLAQDLIKASHPLDKMLMLRLVSAMKKGHGQECFAIPEFSYGVVEKFYRDFGGKDDSEDMAPLDPMYVHCDFPFRAGNFPSSLELSGDPRSVPEVLVFDYRMRA